MHFFSDLSDVCSTVIWFSFLLDHNFGYVAYQCFLI